MSRLDRTSRQSDWSARLQDRLECSDAQGAISALALFEALIWFNVEMHETLSPRSRAGLTLSS
jgi:hypothetical protein